MTRFNPTKSYVINESDVGLEDISSVNIQECLDAYGILKSFKEKTSLTASDKLSIARSYHTLNKHIGLSIPTAVSTENYHNLYISQEGIKETWDMIIRKIKDFFRNLFNKLKHKKIQLQTRLKLFKQLDFSVAAFRVKNPSLGKIPYSLKFGEDRRLQVITQPANTNELIHQINLLKDDVKTLQGVNTLGTYLEQYAQNSDKYVEDRELFRNEIRDILTQYGKSKGLTYTGINDNTHLSLNLLLGFKFYTTIELGEEIKIEIFSSKFRKLPPSFDLDEPSDALSLFLALKDLAEEIPKGFNKWYNSVKSDFDKLSRFESQVINAVSEIKDNGDEEKAKGFIPMLEDMQALYKIISIPVFYFDAVATDVKTILGNLKPA